MFGTGITAALAGEICLRLLLGAVLGAVIGLERSYRLKEAGTRTHLIVCATATLLMVLSKYAFGDVADGTKAADSARIAAQVVSGVSFLCAGVIFRIGKNIKGLTTAAGLWMTSAVGLTVGAGLYAVALFMVIVVLAFQTLLHRHPIGNDSVTNYTVTVTLAESVPFEVFKEKLMAVTGGRCELTGASGTAESMKYTVSVHTPTAVPADSWRALMQENEGVTAVEVEIVD